MRPADGNTRLLVSFRGWGLWITREPHLPARTVVASEMVGFGSTPFRHTGV